MMYLVLKPFTTAIRRFRPGEERHENELTEGAVLSVDELVEREFVEPLLQVGESETEQPHPRRRSRRSVEHSDEPPPEAA